MKLINALVVFLAIVALFGNATETTKHHLRGSKKGGRYREQKNQVDPIDQP